MNVYRVALFRPLAAGNIATAWLVVNTSETDAAHIIVSAFTTRREAEREADALNAAAERARVRHSRGDIRQNPATLALHLAGNPVGRRSLIARDVLWVVYRHNDDGKLYGHAFGTESFDIKGKGTSIVLTGTAETSKVEAWSRPGGEVLLKHRDGLPVWENVE